MPRTRRRFLAHLLGGAALSAAAVSPARVGAFGAEPARPGAGRYDYLGRTPGYREWAIVPRGLTVRSIESFRRESLALVRVTASDGTTGWGQIAPYEADISAEVLHRLVARLVVGRDVSEIDAISDAVIDAQLKYPWSFLCRALAGVDTALWDLYGQITGKPVAVLLGGSVRPVPAYGSSMRRDISPADEAARLARLRDALGCRAFKIRLGTPGGRNRDASPGRSHAIIPAVRQAVGPDIALLADANSCYTPDVAIPMGRRLEDAGYAAFEEPCPYWELEWTQEVTRALSIDVQGGEQDNDLAQWRRMIAMRAVDIVQPDICYVGGLTRAWRVAKMAEAAGLPTKPHAANVSLVTVFTMHLLAALPKAGEVEFSIEHDPLGGVPATYCARDRDPDPDNITGEPEESNPFGVATLKDGSVLVSDAAANDLLRVYPNGRIVTVARLKPRMVAVPDELPDEGFPPAGMVMPSEGVATSVAVGADGYYYVGELRGFPATPGTSQIWRIAPDSVNAVCDPEAPTAGPCRRYADGFTSIVDLEAGADGSLYVVELAKQSWLQWEEGIGGPPIGSVFRLVPGGASREELAAGTLMLPAGVAVGRGGAVYVTTPVFGPGAVLQVQ